MSVVHSIPQHEKKNDTPELDVAHNHKTIEALQQEVARADLRLKLKKVECQIQEALNDYQQLLSSLEQLAISCQDIVAETTNKSRRSIFHQWLPTWESIVESSSSASSSTTTAGDHNNSSSSQESLRVQREKPSPPPSSTSDTRSTVSPITALLPSDSNSTLQGRRLFPQCKSSSSENNSDKAVDSNGCSSSSGSSPSRAQQIRKRNQKHEERVRDILDSLSDANERRASF